MEELAFTFQYDIEDVEENLSAFEIWNPKLETLLVAYQKDSLSALDSLDDKIQTANEFIFFG